MSEINSFSDYTNKYNSNVDYSALFGGTSNSSSLGGTNILSDYASIKNGSYGKLLKAYYAKQDAEKTAGTGDTSQKLTLMKTSADSLKKSADALNASSLWEKKKIKKKDEETGEETLKKSDISSLQSVFTGYNSHASKISQKATSIGNAASRSKAVTYTSSGSYSNTLPKLVPSTVDERVGDKDKSSDTSSKTTEK